MPATNILSAYTTWFMVNHILTDIFVHAKVKVDEGLSGETVSPKILAGMTRIESKTQSTAEKKKAFNIFFSAVIIF
ncbi:MAG: hypothetical protein VB012_00150 [Erysipelotrichaceae bacterium]|nr:hypothetical protein [Erysipelotrichaceae bacterium]